MLLIGVIIILVMHSIVLSNKSYECKRERERARYIRCTASKVILWRSVLPKKSRCREIAPKTAINFGQSKRQVTIYKVSRVYGVIYQVIDHFTWQRRSFNHHNKRVWHATEDTQYLPQYLLTTSRSSIKLRLSKRRCARLT